MCQGKSLCHSHKYSHSNAPVMFLTTSGSSAAGPAYWVNYTDEVGNVVNGAIRKPECISDYHNKNTRIDDRNKLRKSSYGGEEVSYRLSISQDSYGTYW